MSVAWGSIWPEVKRAVQTAQNKTDALRAVTRLRGKSTSWESLRGAWNRRESSALQISGGPTVPRGQGRKHFVIPDTQVRPGVSVEHFRWLGRYIAAKAPDVVIHLGDHWDMPSLSSYDSPVRKAYEGRAKLADIRAGNDALEILEHEIERAGISPRKIYLEGNHDGFASEGRIGRFLADNPDMRGLITPSMFADSWLGWERVPFLTQIDVDGILYAHLFPFSRAGRVSPGALRNGAGSAKIQVQAMMRSCTAGHRQGLDTAWHHTPHTTYRGIIAGSCYTHDEDYMGPGNRHWRGALMKHDVGPHNPNHYDLMEVSLDFLKRRYE